MENISCDCVECNSKINKLSNCSRAECGCYYHTNCFLEKIMLSGNPNEILCSNCNKLIFNDNQKLIINEKVNDNYEKIKNSSLFKSQKIVFLRKY